LQSASTTSPRATGNGNPAFGMRHIASSPHLAACRPTNGALSPTSDDSLHFSPRGGGLSPRGGGLPPRGGGHSQAHPHSPTAQHNRMMNRVRRH
jgi:hypothetical protein